MRLRAAGLPGQRGWLLLCLPLQWRHAHHLAPERREVVLRRAPLKVELVDGRGGLSLAGWGDKVGWNQVSADHELEECDFF